MSDINLSKTKDSVADSYIQHCQDLTTQAVVQQIQSYLYSKTKSCLVKGWNKQSKNGGVVRLPTIQNTENLLLGSQNTLVMLHAEKLVTLGTDHFWYGPENKHTGTLEVFQ